jgi:hypothetical protein
MSDARRDAEDLRRAFLARKHGAPPSGECPTAEHLWASAVGTLSLEDFRRVVDHTAACPPCAAAWRLAREMGAEETSHPARPVWARVRWQYLAAACVAAVTLSGLAVRFHLSRPSEPAPYRVSEPREIRSLVSPGEVLRRSSCLLRWSSGLPGARHTVYVTDEDLNPIVVGQELDAEHFLVPESALQPLAAGAKVLWRVEAAHPDGRRRSSPTFVNRLE